MKEIVSKCKNLYNVKKYKNITTKTEIKSKVTNLSYGIKMKTIWALKSGHSKNIYNVKVEKYKMLVRKLK